jgi:RHS repeat-associated protein
VITMRFVYGTRSNVPDLVKTYAAAGAADKTYRVSTDQLGTPRVLEDAAGNVLKAMDFDEFGIKLSDSNPAFDFPFGFAGGLYDADTKLTRFGARDYDASIGRWVSKDPILFGGGQTNLYVYAENDPVNRIDPSGLLGTYLGFTIGAGSPWAPILGALFGYSVPSGLSFSIGTFTNFDFSKWEYTYGLYATKTTSLDLAKLPGFCNVGAEGGAILKNVDDFKGAGNGAGADFGKWAGQASWSPGGVVPTTVGGNVAYGEGGFVGTTSSQTSIIGLAASPSGISVAR